MEDAGRRLPTAAKPAPSRAPNKMFSAVLQTTVEQRRTKHMTDTGAPVERTLVLLKPDAVARGTMGRVLTRFEDALLKVVGSKMVWMDADLTRKHRSEE